jgi:Mrp family chromosome partitioning ATPase
MGAAAQARLEQSPSGWLRHVAPRGGPNGPLAGERPRIGAPRQWPILGSDELFRGIYTRSGSGASETLAVCSAIAGEGKTTIGLGLGETIAQDFPERQVLVVETDVRRPVLAAGFGVEPCPGLVDYLLDGQPLPAAYRSTHLDNLHLVPAGGPAAHAGRLLRSTRLPAALDAMRRTHDLVILDVPAILTNSDSLLLTDLSDGVIFVVRAGVTPISLVTKAVEQLDAEKLRGLVLNGARSAIPGWLRRLCGLW